MMIRKILLIFFLLPTFLIVLAHNTLPAHHHDDDQQEKTHQHAHTHGHHHHDHLHQPDWNDLLDLLKNIPHPDTENQSQQIFVKHINKQEIAPVDVVPVLLSFYEYQQTSELQIFVITEDEIPKDLLFSHFIPLRAPPVMS